MKPTIAMLHYASPPGVGGVELTIAHHAYGLADLGYKVRVISGKGAPFDNRIETCVNPLFGSTHPDVLSVKTQLDRGEITEDFARLTDTIAVALHPLLVDCAALITHNVHTLNKSLPLTAALAQVTRTLPLRSLAWCHDMAWTNPQYQPELHPGMPWDLLRQPWEKTVYVTVSMARQTELADLLGVTPETVRVVFPGVDVARFNRWTPTTARLVEALHLLNTDGVLLLPARLTRRKNVALALHTLAALRHQTGKDFRLVVTGPPGPHNPTNPGYLGELLDLRRSLGIEDSAHFLYAYSDGEQPLMPDDYTMADLYRLADALFFPSVQEGFGIPVLEAGLAGIPVFCADIPPFRHTGGDDITYFDPMRDSAEDIAARVWDTLQRTPTYRLRTRVRHTYRWETIIRDQIIPLLEAA